MRDKIWHLFKLTGDIKYYMMYREMDRAELDESSKRERNNNKR